jgi:hypothetical protein
MMNHLLYMYIYAAGIIVLIIAEGIDGEEDRDVPIGLSDIRRPC